MHGCPHAQVEKLTAEGKALQGQVAKERANSAQQRDIAQKTTQKLKDTDGQHARAAAPVDASRSHAPP